LFIILMYLDTYNIHIWFGLWHFQFSPLSCKSSNWLGILFWHNINAEC
jgi:hypothetical protein